MTPKQFNKAMGAVVRRHRTQRGLSQSDIARVLGVSYQQVQKSECGINGFSSHYLPDLAQRLGLSVAELFDQIGISSIANKASEAENDAILAARYVAKIANSSFRRHVIDLARKCAYHEPAA